MFYSQDKFAPVSRDDRSKRVNDFEQQVGRANKP